MGTGALLLLSLALLVFLIAVFVYALSENLQVMERWLERPYRSPFSFPLAQPRRRSSSLQAWLAWCITAETLSGRTETSTRYSPPNILPPTAGPLSLAAQGTGKST
jgi:hypothetical protein